MIKRRNYVRRFAALYQGVVKFVRSIRIRVPQRAMVSMAGMKFKTTGVSKQFQTTRNIFPSSARSHTIRMPRQVPGRRDVPYAVLLVPSSSRFRHSSRSTQSNQLHVPVTLPSSLLANLLNTAGLKSRSVGAQPVHRSTTVTSTDPSPSRRTRIFLPHSGLLFGFPPLCTSSHKKCETETIMSLSLLVFPQAPSPGA